MYSIVVCLKQALIYSRLALNSFPSAEIICKHPHTGLLYAFYKIYSYHNCNFLTISSVHRCVPSMSTIRLNNWRYSLSEKADPSRAWSVDHSRHWVFLLISLPFSQEDLIIYYLFKIYQIVFVPQISVHTPYS